jgi:hypothetical protein
MDTLSEDYLKSTRDLKYIIGRYNSKTTHLSNVEPSSLKYHLITMK